MKDLSSPEIEQYRFTGGAAGIYGESGNSLGGAFMMPSLHDGDWLLVTASVGGGWDHVSVSLQHRCPTWGEMEQVANLFFLPGEVAFQLHLPRKLHINVHNFCLHWWRPNSDGAIPLPPTSFV